ncbi:MAG: hypothetical protein IJ946_05255 [Clostridia bacterium]|nr:hypothetical protein [Clostridia bacterium]
MSEILPLAEQMLNSYVDYSDILTNDAFLPSFLSKNIGRWMKVEHYLNGKEVTHIGKLFKVGLDFLVLQLNSDRPATTICNLKDVKFITIIYDTDKNSLI